MTKTDIKEALEKIVKELRESEGWGKDDSKVNKKTESQMCIRLSKAISKEYIRRGDGGLYLFTGKRYIFLGENDTDMFLAEVVRRLDWGSVYLVGSITIFRKYLLNDMGVKEFEPKLRFLSFENCVLDLDTGDVLEFSPSWESRIELDFEYHKEAKAERWEKFLYEVIDDGASIRVLQEFLGLVFIDKEMLSIETALYLFGYGSNGKSVVYDIIKTILGKNCSSFDLFQLCTHQNSDYYTAEANGKLLNFCSDMGDKDFSGGRYKQISAREPITVRPIGRAPFEARDMPLLAASINKMPTTSDSSDGYWRRSKIIVFPKTFTEEQQDKELKKKLREEVSGIFNWIMEGRERILSQKGKFTNSNVMLENVKKARIDSDSVLGWMFNEGYYTLKNVPQSEEWLEEQHLTSIFYQSYCEYCQENGNKPKNRPNFVQGLKQAGAETIPKMREGDKVSSGVRLLKLKDKNYIEGEEELPF